MEQSTRFVAGRPRIGDHPGDDRSDRPPGDPDERPDGALRGVRREPCDRIVEDPGVAGFVTGPGDRDDDHPVNRAADSRRVGLQVRLRRPEIERPPASPTVASVIAWAPPPADPAAEGLPC